jgi:hypothetical protein
MVLRLGTANFRDLFCLVFSHISSLVIISGVCAPSNNQNFFATDGDGSRGLAFLSDSTPINSQVICAICLLLGNYIDGMQFGMHIVAEDLGTGLATLPRLEIQRMALL